MEEVHPKWANLRPKQRALSPELKAELEADIVTAYKRLKNLRAVARYVNRNHEYVRRVLNKHNVPLMPIGRPWPSKSGPGAYPVPTHEKRELAALAKLMTSTIQNPNIKKGK